MMAALSEYATTVCCGEVAWVWRIMPNRLWLCAWPSMLKLALKILWRQCSLLAWANIISSASLGLRPSLLKASSK